LIYPFHFFLSKWNENPFSFIDTIKDDYGTNPLSFMNTIKDDYGTNPFSFISITQAVPMHVNYDQ